MKKRPLIVILVSIIVFETIMLCLTAKKPLPPGWEHFGWKFEDTAAMRRDTTIRDLKTKEYWTEVAQRNAAKEADDSLAQYITIEPPPPPQHWRYFRFSFLYRGKDGGKIYGTNAMQSLNYPSESRLKAYAIFFIKGTPPKAKDITIWDITEFKNEADYISYEYLRQ